jgi:hypothetical protein
MSEQRDDGIENDDAETEREEGGEDSAPDRESEGEEDEADEGRAAPRPVDWEKRAHGNAGQAARERSRRQAAERRSQELEARLETLERRSGGGNENELLALIAQLRDDDEDPVGDIASVKRALKLYRAREVQSEEQQRAQSHVQRQVDALRNTMADAEADFTLDHPDYKDAAAFYREARAEELKEAGYSGEQLMQKLADDLFGMVRTSFSTGLDPAERVYALARKRGFKPGGKAADRKLEAFDRAAGTGVRPQARAAAGVLSWGDVAKLDGAARDKAWAKLRERELARK